MSPPLKTVKTDPERRERWKQFMQTLNPGIDSRAIRLMDEIRMVSHALYQMGENSLSTAGLSYAQYRILMALFFTEQVEGRGELNPSEISEHQGTSRNTVSSLIASLEDQVLVERHLDKQDKRKFNISLTEAGRTLVRAHVSQHFEIIGRCFSTLTSGEQETLSQLLGKLNVSIHCTKHDT